MQSFYQLFYVYRCVDYYQLWIVLKTWLELHFHTSLLNVVFDVLIQQKGDHDSVAFVIMRNGVLEVEK